MRDKINIGSAGEQLAAEFLVKRGFSVEHRNYRHNRGEIDLIVTRGDWLIFVEVKTRTTTDFGEPEEFVTPRQRLKILRAAENYIFQTNWQGHVRFDIVAIKPGHPPEIVHLEDAIT